MSTTDEKRMCVEKDCGREFALTQDNIKFFGDKGLVPPKRCDKCRNRRKMEARSAFGDISRDMRNKENGERRRG